eukprot:3804658-Amphidinium_carterae.1
MEFLSKAPRAHAPFMSFAKQRFDSSLNVCRRFVRYSRGMILWLSEVASGGHRSVWAKDILCFLLGPTNAPCPQNLLLLALLTELLESVSRFIHTCNP